MLQCLDIAYKRGEKTIFNGFDFKAGGGDIIVLKGANGSGKTTLLKILCGILRPLKGRVLWNNGDIFSDIETYRHNIHFIGHKNALNRDLTVNENLTFWAEISGNPELVTPAVSYMNMEKIADIPYRMLSAGWQRRVALSRLMLSDGSIWLLDEPLTNLDQEGAELIKNLVKAKSQAGGIIVMSNHGDEDISGAHIFRL